MSVKLFIKKNYWIFDNLVSLFCLICIPLCFTGTMSAPFLISFLAFLALYFFTISVIGMKFSTRKTAESDSERNISKNWLLPIYLVNVLVCVELFFPVCQIFYGIEQKRFAFLALGLTTIFLVIFNVTGQPKFLRMVVNDFSIPRVFRIFSCVAGALRTGLFLHCLIGFSFPFI